MSNKLRKTPKENEDRCKNIHRNLNVAMGLPERLEPNLTIVMDTDNLQRQVNSLAFRMDRLERVQARRNWKRKK